MKGTMETHHHLKGTVQNNWHPPIESLMWMSPRAVAWLATDIGTGAWTDKGVPKGVVETKAELDACKKVINLDVFCISLSVCLSLVWQFVCHWSGSLSFIGLAIGPSSI